MEQQPKFQETERGRQFNPLLGPLGYNSSSYHNSSI